MRGLSIESCSSKTSPTYIAGQMDPISGICCANHLNGLTMRSSPKQQYTQSLGFNGISPLADSFLISYCFISNCRTGITQLKQKMSNLVFTVGNLQCTVVLINIGLFGELR